jgi:hypothetical protein
MLYATLPTVGGALSCCSPRREKPSNRPPQARKRKSMATKMSISLFMVTVIWIGGSRPSKKVVCTGQVDEGYKTGRSTTGEYLDSRFGEYKEW